MIRYTLSNRQRKELYVRNTQIQVAIPAPPGPLGDVLDFARHSLDSVDREDVAEVEECEILVDPTTHILPAKHLTDLLGEIVNDDRRSNGQLVVSIAVVVITLKPRKVVHHARGVQWAHQVLIDGTPLFAQSSD